MLSSCISPLFTSPYGSRETLFEGPAPNRQFMHESASDTTPMTSKEQPTFSADSGSGSSARDSAPIRLRTVRVWFSPNGLELMEDIKKKGLEDVVVDAIDLQELGTQYQAHGDHGTTKGSFLVDLAVLEAGITRVMGKYGILKFVPLSSDDPIILQQPAEALDSKKALCYQRLHSKYSHEYVKRQRFTKSLGVEMNKIWTDWYDDCLREIGNHLRKLGYC